MALVALWLALFGAWRPGEAPGSSPRVAAQAAPGRILAVVGRQVGWLNLEAPRPQVLTAFQAPSFAMDVAAIPASTLAAVAVAEPLAGQVEPGGDLLGLDLSSSNSSPPPAPVPLVLRADAGEWLGAPMWLPDGSALVFQREDLRAGSDLYAGQAAVRYPARIELAAPGGTRSVLVTDGHHPSPSPDGSELAFVRLSPHGTALLVHSLVDGAERVLVPPGTLPDITYPRYAPSGDRLAFMATTASSQQPVDRASQPSIRRAGRPTIDVADLLGPRPALAHGLPWNLWVVGRDGSGLHQVAPVGADDASVAWSPDGSQLFVYGSTGARLVDASTGETQLLTFLAGFGAIAWLP